MMKALLVFVWVYLSEVIAPLWARVFVRQSVEERPGELLIHFNMKGRWFTHRVSYGMDNMDDYDSSSDATANLFVKRDMSIVHKKVE